MMTTTDLITNALAKLGNNEPSGENLAQGLKELNNVLATLTWWDETEQPIWEYTTLHDTVNLPAHFTNALEWSLAAQSATAYGLPVDRCLLVKKQADEAIGLLKNRRGVYRYATANSTVV